MSALSFIQQLQQRKLLANHFLRFLLAGGAATALQLILLISFVELLALPKIAASAMSYAISAVFNYLLNYHLTFSSTKSHADTAPKFVFAVCLGLSANTASFYLLLALLPHYVMAQICATLVTITSNFLILKYWIFREEK